MLERVLGACACQVCSPVSGCGCGCVCVCLSCVQTRLQVWLWGCVCVCVCVSCVQPCLQVWLWVRVLGVCVCLRCAVCVSRVCAAMSLGVSVRHHLTPRC